MSHFDRLEQKEKKKKTCKNTVGYSDPAVNQQQRSGAGGSDYPITNPSVQSEQFQPPDSPADATTEAFSQ